MTLFTRRDALHAGLGALAGTTMLGTRGLRAQVAVKDVQAPKFEIEEGASLRVLRPSKFVQGDETLFLENTKKFTDQTGVQVTVNSESWEDLRPKTATAAAIGSGPDIVLAWSDDPHKFASRCVDLTDLATYLGEKYGGWWPIVEKYGRDQKTGN
jgi:multiple sugar transport system substrate-binding protein